MGAYGAGASWLMSLADALGIPLGAKHKKIETNDSKGGTKEELAPQLAVIAEITRDDICLTDKPFFTTSKRIRLGKQLKSKVEDLTKALNKMVRSTAFDLLVDGHSVWKLRELNGEVFFEPVVDECEFYLKDNRILCVIDGKVLEDLIIFVNYEKRDLEVAEFNDHKAFKINPVGFQTRYTKDLLSKLTAAENAVAKLRAQTRYIRFATVEVGLNKGDQQQAVVDDISEGLNANSDSLPQPEVFQDNIPVFPTRKSIGKPEVQEFAPSTEIGKLSDIEYYQTQLATYTRFPKSYSDFSSNLSATALSMIRGDVRYERIVSACRSLIENTINDYVGDIEVIKKAGIEWSIKSIPSSEDSDVINSLTEITALVSQIFEVISSEEDRLVAEQKVKILLEFFDTVKETSIISEVKKDITQLVALMFSTPGGESEGVSNTDYMDDLPPDDMGDLPPDDADSDFTPDEEPPE